MRYVIILAILLAGCYDDRKSVTSNGGVDYTVTCLDGVEYYTRGNHFAPRFNRWGKIMMCNDKSSGIVDPEFKPQSWSSI